MRLQLIEIIASNFPLLQGEGKGGDGVAQQFSSPFVTAGRHESFIMFYLLPVCFSQADDLSWAYQTIGL